MARGKALTMVYLAMLWLALRRHSALQLLKIFIMLFKDAQVRILAVVDLELVWTINISEFFDIANSERNYCEAKKNQQKFIAILKTELRFISESE